MLILLSYQARVGAVEDRELLLSGLVHEAAQSVEFRQQVHLVVGGELHIDGVLHLLLLS